MTTINNSENDNDDGDETEEEYQTKWEDGELLSEFLANE